VPFAFGLQFDPDAFKATGRAGYDGLVVGHVRGEGRSNAYDINGSIHIDVDFDRGSSSGYFDLAGRNDVTGEVVNFGRTNLVPGGADRYISSAPATGGSLQAFFAGRQAQEVMGAFNALLYDPKEPSQAMRATGSFAGKR